MLLGKKHFQRHPHLSPSSGLLKTAKQGKAGLPPNPKGKPARGEGLPAFEQAQENSGQTQEPPTGGADASPERSGESGAGLRRCLQYIRKRVPAGKSVCSSCQALRRAGRSTPTRPAHRWREGVSSQLRALPGQNQLQVRDAIPLCQNMIHQRDAACPSASSVTGSVTAGLAAELAPGTADGSTHG